MSLLCTTDLKELITFKFNEETKLITLSLMKRQKQGVFCQARLFYFELNLGERFTDSIKIALLKTDL